MTLKCLTVQQPWAWLLVNGHKDVENRTWQPAALGVIAIHAGKRLLAANVERAQALLGCPVPDEFEVGSVVGLVRIDAVVRSSESPWFSGPIGWRVGAAIAFHDADCFAVRGRLGLFDVTLPPQLAPLAHDLLKL